MAAITGLGVGGPAKSYGLFDDKSFSTLPATRITRLGLGGPMMLYNNGDPFGDKAEAGDEASSFNYPIYARKRGRR